MSTRPVDLYRHPLTRPFLRPAAQTALRALWLAGTVALIALGWGYDAIPGVPDLHPRVYTHATTLLFWVFWFMGLVAVVPVLGRAWCGVCPLGWVADGLGRRGLGLPWPRWIARGWGSLAVFGAGVAAVVWFEANLSPHATAALIAGVVGLAVGSAVLWRRSAFCRGLCPVGTVLSLYARHTPLAVRARDPGRCRACGRACVATDPEWRRLDWGRWVWFRRRDRAGCPVALDPTRMDPTECLLCLRCVRRCPEGNLGVWWGRRPAAGALPPARAVFLGALLGLVSLALYRTWPEAEVALTPGVLPPAWFRALWMGAVVPAVLLGLPPILGRLGARVTGRPAAGAPGSAPGPGPKARGWGWLAALPAFVGPVLGGHLALALVKLNAKAAYLPYLVYDPWGAETYLAIHASGLLPKPDLLLPLAALRWVALGVLAAGILRSARVLWWRVRDPATRPAAAWYLPSWLVVSGGLAAALWHWLGG
ncbi:4Fe-4S binding protein [Deferrisoma sp.]